MLSSKSFRTQSPRRHWRWSQRTVGKSDTETTYNLAFKIKHPVNFWLYKQTKGKLFNYGSLLIQNRSSLTREKRPNLRKLTKTGRQNAQLLKCSWWGLNLCWEPIPSATQGLELLVGNFATFGWSQTSCPLWFPSSWYVKLTSYQL